MRIFLAGAAGAIGRRLMPLLLGAGHRVTGTTRHAETARPTGGVNQVRSCDLRFLAAVLGV